jgi:hypothetical protein
VSSGVSSCIASGVADRLCLTGVEFGLNRLDFGDPRPPRPLWLNRWDCLSLVGAPDGGCLFVGLVLGFRSLRGSIVFHSSGLVSGGVSLNSLWASMSSMS